MDCSAIVLNKLLAERDLDIWAKLKLGFLDSAYSSLYSAISRYYDKYSNIPSFEELELTIREGAGQKTLATLKLIDEPDISAEVALDALIDQFTQNQTINMLEKFVDKLPIYDTAEIKENLSSIVLHLDEKTLTTEGVYNMADIMLFRTSDELDRERVHLGLNNTFDAVLGGVARQELILIGGKRGAGKSITSSNICVNQYEMGNTTVYFSIEMIAHETLERKMAILSDVPYLHLKQNKLTDDELLRVIKARAKMFDDSQELVIDFMRDRVRFKFEKNLVTSKKLKEDNQMIIIDDRALTITSIDIHLGKIKARFGNKLTVCVVDYLNQIVVPEGHNQFDWKPQIDVSKRLKELARKHEVVMVSPYQIDSTGEARFAKGILDAADVALVLEANKKEDNAISYDTTKIRGGPPMFFTSPINWDTLKISSTPIEKPREVEDGKSKKAIKRAKGKVEEEASDVKPWEG
jgi:replicative DNA helicase